jgi:hypothetical protein
VPPDSWTNAKLYDLRLPGASVRKGKGSLPNRDALRDLVAEAIGKKREVGVSGEVPAMR